MYIKYTNKKPPFQWEIWIDRPDSIVKTMILDSYGRTKPYITTLDFRCKEKYWKMEYLTEEEVDLLKLEYL